MKIKHVYGNVLRLDIPLTIKIVTSEGGHAQETEEPFYPDTSKPVLVELANQYNITKYAYEATMTENVAHIEDRGDIKIGIYKVTVKCYDEQGQPYRYMARDIVEIVDATADAGIEAGIEFNSETYTLEGAVFISYGVEQVQSDWNEQDDESKAYIKNKPDLTQYATKNELKEVEDEIPTLPDHIVTDEYYVHTDNNYTDAEKEKLADLENYDDSEIRQELGGKVDKEQGKGLSTNDYTNEEKTKLANAITEEQDPTVPLWAKQSTKPSYTPQEVGALPANTPLFDGDYNSLTNKPDLSGFITISVNNLVNYYLKSETYTKQEVQGLIAAIQQFHYEIYASTSDVTTPQGNVLYLIGPTGTGDDKYEEYVYDATKQEPWVKIGDTSIDLSDYYTKGQADSAITQALNTALADYTTTAALTLLLAGKQDVISDLATIRSGAAAGATAYQKPQGGIPSTDMSQGVQTSLGKADTSLQPTQQTLTDAQKQQVRNNIGAAGTGDVPTLPDNISYFSDDDGEGIIPMDGIRAVTVASAAAITVNPDVVTVINGVVGTAAITLQVPNDNLAHVWDILMTTDSSVAVTFAMSNSATILTPSGFSIGASKAVEISVIGVGTKYYLRYGEFA